MALNISPVHRNLHTRVTFLHLEFEDWFVVIGLAALTNIFGRWIDWFTGQYQKAEGGGIKVRLFFQMEL